MKIRNSPSIAFIAFVFSVLAWTSAYAQHSNGILFTVNSNADSVDAVAGDGVCADLGGQCTLRAAVEEADTTIARDVIVFDLAQPALIDLTVGELFISKGLDIVGPGARQLTIRRSIAPNTPAFRIFHVARDVTPFTMRDVTVRNGNGGAGGALFVDVRRRLSCPILRSVKTAQQWVVQ